MDCISAVHIKGHKLQLPVIVKKISGLGALVSLSVVKIKKNIQIKVLRYVRPALAFLNLKALIDLSFSFSSNALTWCYFSHIA